ncbi:nitrite reductase large subunit NirB [Microlunatus sp. Gsoil 973]|uniref:nitrite reductase large subunit NirB n=1 Tax=Microlunatus sp. Gsoil 973 TaxID=2672569 RepID=UPI0012B4A72E|nr:nitrite reductase large subunit NirB [Microlunatus sp. Gsoil 973]QGN34697.1 nitrite reductase large subunit [Microlunatus sp. Gsoil 973]
MPSSPNSHRIVVVGGGPAAFRLVDALTTRGLDGRTVTVVGEEPHPPYDRVNLARRWDPGTDLRLGDPSLWQRPDVALLSGERVTEIDRQERVVRTDAGRALEYDELVLATGSNAWAPPVPGAELAGVHVYRTIADVDRMRQHLGSLTGRKKPTALIVGGGLLGLEAAGGLVTQGVDVRVVQLAPWLMPAQLDQGGGQALGRLISDLGVQVQNDVGPRRIERSETGSFAVTLTDDSLVAADLVIFAVGVRPRDELGRDAGLEIGPRGGVVVDDACRTSDPRIWAIGEVACLPERGCVGLVAPANAMAEVVADRVLGGEGTFPGVDDSTKLKLSGIDVAVFGDALSRTEDCLDVVYADPARGVYQKLVMSDDGRTLLGGILVGDAAAYASLRPMVGRELGAEPASYLAAAGAELPGAGELPDDAQVCSCNAVSAGTIRGAVRGGCCDIAGLKACTRAGTQCGSCVGLVQKLLNTELAAAGVEIPKAVCEHFALSRSELFEAVRIAGPASFTAIVERFGVSHEDGTVNRGCDICKPMVASILASLHDEYVLSDGRGTLQDTNDRALANLQKDGTYSVVPRIPGGEITPAKLKVIAEVAEDFGLYTKITGGQRIDLFGARLDQLPDIWERLIQAGMESGHAYGKAVRTVKSCVGSTWCRYGVQDSVGMAIELELRYRGLRSPHKIKLGVSGCARECAEARSKDVGVIATDKGWNLYVGGNGGFTPRHAELLIGDLSDEMLIKVIDRFVMYYIRTADRLQRTAAWIAELDGGLDHLREVILEDSLGICADLEEAMERHARSYTDEWAATLADPERLRRFRSFVNAAEPDQTITRVPERGQWRPPHPHEEDSAVPQNAVLAWGPTIPVRGR